MLSNEQYETLSLSILGADDPLLTILEADRDLLPDNPEIWPLTHQLMIQLKEDGKLEDIQLSRFGPIQKCMEAFRSSIWARIEKVPAELFKMEHVFLFFQKNDDPVFTPKDKILVSLCCEFTLGIMEGLRAYEPSKEEFDLFKSTFLKHVTAKEYQDELDGSKTDVLGQVFQRAKTLRSELQDYYLAQIRADILHFFRDRRDRQIDFQLVFDGKLATQNDLESNMSMPAQDGGLSKISLNPLVAKLDLMRILDALSMLRFFVKEDGQIAGQKEVILAFGKFLGEDLTSFPQMLSNSYIDTSLETNLKIFDKMKAQIQPKCINKT